MNGLDIGGWAFLIAAWGSILTITIFCFKRVLSTHNQNKA